MSDYRPQGIRLQWNGRPPYAVHIDRTYAYDSSDSLDRGLEIKLYVSADKGFTTTEFESMTDIVTEAAEWYRRTFVPDRSED